MPRRCQTHPLGELLDVAVGRERCIIAEEGEEYAAAVGLIQAGYTREPRYRRGVGPARTVAEPGDVQLRGDVIARRLHVSIVVTSERRLAGRGIARHVPRAIERRSIV